MEITHQPELAAEVTLQPVRRHGVDAAILFSDIVTPLEAIGVGVEIRPGVGPVIAEPVRTAGDLRRLRPFEPSVDAPWLGRDRPSHLRRAERAAHRLRRRALHAGQLPRRGRPLRESGAHAGALMMSDPMTWRGLLDRLADIALSALAAQVRAGAEAIQVFDSWVGRCPPATTTHMCSRSSGD